MLFGITLKKLLLINFWFSTDITPLSRNFLIGLTIFFLAVFVTSVGCKIVVIQGGHSLLRRRLLNKLFTLLAAISVTGLLILFFRQYNVYFLGARFWFLLLMVAGVIRLVFLFRYVKEQKVVVDELQRKEMIKKYIP